MFRIGELAKKTNITKRTLYHYEEIGLLAPIFVNENRYRYYDNDSLFRLQKILLLKSIGYTLEQIKTFFKRNNDDKDWIISLQQQIDLIEREKEELSRKQYYLKSTIHSIQLKGTDAVNEISKAIAKLNERPLADGVIPAQFENATPFSAEEKEILQRLPVIGSEDERLEEVISLFQQVREKMPEAPSSPEVQYLAGQLYQKALFLFEGNEQLLDKYWEVIKPENDNESIVMGMDKSFMSYIDEMITVFLKRREESNEE